MTQKLDLCPLSSYELIVLFLPDLTLDFVAISLIAKEAELPNR